MLAFPEQTNMSFYLDHCEAASEIYQPFINPDEIKAVTLKCNGSGLNIIDCKHPQRKLFIEEIGGLDFNSITATLRQPQIPYFIPIIPADFFTLSSKLIKYEIIGISLQDIFKSKKRRNNDGLFVPPKLSLKQSILLNEVFKNKSTILFSTGTDTLIEKVRQKSEVIDYFESLAKIGFISVTAMNFSIMFGECPLAHAINLQRSLDSFRETENQGIASIPHFYWANKYHVERIINWLNLNPKINLITINCQRYAPKDYLLIQGGIKYIKKQVNRDMHFLLEGPKKDFLPGLVGISHSIHIAHKNPAMEAINSQKMKFMGGELKTINAHGEDKGLILENNLREYETFLSQNFYKNPIRISADLINSIKQKEKIKIEGLRSKLILNPSLKLKQVVPQERHRKSP